jgi:hypothetical protein
LGGGRLGADFGELSRAARRRPQPPGRRSQETSEPLVIERALQLAVAAQLSAVVPPGAMRNRLLERGAVAEVTIAVTRVTEAAVAVITIPVVAIPMIAVAFAIPMIAVAVFAIEGTLGRARGPSGVP